MFLIGAIYLLLHVSAHATQWGPQSARRHAPDYSHHFAVRVPGDITHVRQQASRHACTVHSEIGIGELRDFYLWECRRVTGDNATSTRRDDYLLQRLLDSSHVHWAEQQYFKRRSKRDGSQPPVSPSRHASRLRRRQTASHFGGGANSLSLFDWHLRHFASPPVSFLSDDQMGDEDGTLLSSMLNRRRFGQSYWPDPLYPAQWYLHGGAKDGNDMNVIDAWRRGYTGRGVVISILDDGIQSNHPDLISNYDPEASLDINDNDSDPTPRDNGQNRHGTRCAGEVAAIAGNQYCGVGIAPNSSIGGVRMLDGGVNDYVEARALSFNRDHIDIYSASWGPEDDGKTVDGPGPLARRAFIDGVLKGRHGLGSIFVWASGNGGQYTDNCNCDGYTNSIFTLSISSASQAGLKPWYLEECASTLATTYSSGSQLYDKSVATCDQDAALRHKHICTVSHTGTSASAPLAAGLCALALEANPKLTWRDMQYIVLMTSRYEPLAKESGWITNGVGRKVSHKFGYGLMDGASMVDLAKRWTSVPLQHICISEIDRRTRVIPGHSGATLRVAMYLNACAGTSQHVRHLEHVQCKVTLRFVPRGNLRISLTSPNGTVSRLLFSRPRDVAGDSFDRWPFMSVHFWGESPRGYWNLSIENTYRRVSHADGLLKEWQMIVYGTEEYPIRLKSSLVFDAAPVAAAAFDDNFRFSDRSIQFASASPQRRSFDIGSQNVSSNSISVSVDGAAFLNGGRSGSRNNSRYCSPGCVHACQLNRLSLECSLCKQKYDSQCEQVCAAGMYLDARSLSCEHCHAHCRACFGPRLAQCLQCGDDYHWIPDLQLCASACPDGYYLYRDTLLAAQQLPEQSVHSTLSPPSVCLSCGVHCASCVSALECTSCDSDLVLHGGACYHR